MAKKAMRRIETIKKEKMLFIKATAIHLFGKYADRYSKYFLSLKDSLVASGIGIFFRTYLSLMFFLPLVSFLLAFLIILNITIILNLALGLSILGLIVMPSLAACTTFLILFLYPTSKARARKTNIDSNLPFAINHMSAIAGSGVPPYTIFRILSKFPEYGEITKEFRKIVRNIEVFGLDEIAALREVIAKSPSKDFKNLLEGILTTTQTGGNLKAYLNQQAEKAMFDYRISRERYSQTLSVYADLYTALLIAAPLLFVVIFAVLGVLGGGVFGIPVGDLINVGVFFVIPILNILFLTFIYLTQPKV
jgi:flagellar protein FlaJ